MAKGVTAINILLITNAAERTAMVRKVLQATRPNCRLHTIGAGHSALPYLRRDGDYAKAPKGDLILFDLIQPTPTDIRLVRGIKADKKLASIPVVLLTTAESEEVIALLSGNRSNQIMFSSIDLEKFLETMGSTRRDRFLGALKLIVKLGYVPVRMPQEGEHQPPGFDLATLSVPK